MSRRVLKPCMVMAGEWVRGEATDLLGDVVDHGHVCLDLVHAAGVEDVGHQCVGGSVDALPRACTQRTGGASTTPLCQHGSQLLRKAGTQAAVPERPGGARGCWWSYR